MVPSTLFFGSGFPHEVANETRGAFVIAVLLLFA